MRAAPHILLCILCLTLLAAGCVEDDYDPNSPEGKVDTAVMNLNSALRSTIQTACACWVDEEHQADCIDQNYRPVQLPACHHAAAACHVAEFDDYTGCIASASERMDECISSCPDAEGAQAASCQSQYDQAVETCDENISQELFDSFQECNSRDMPTCADEDTDEDDAASTETDPSR
jgi:hypothetical protein